MARTEHVDFDAYVAARWARLVRVAVLLGADVHEAEDLVQTALVRCLVRWRRVQRADDVDAYVHRVVVTTFLSARARRWTGERPTEHLPESAVEEPGHDDRDVVRRALAALPVDQRAVVVLRHHLDLSERQTAETLGIAPGTVKSRLSRGLRALATDPTLIELRGAR